MEAAPGGLLLFSVAIAQQLLTTTHRPKTHASTRSDLAHARETSREKGEQRGVRRGENVGFGWLALARSCPESAPVLAGIGEKKPTDSGWFLEFWWQLEI